MSSTSRDAADAGASAAAGEPLVPLGSCDAQIHVFGDPARYPVRHADPLYATPTDSIADARRLHDRLGFTRTVIVQATIYKTDHALLKDVLASERPDRCRGVAIVDDSVDDAELAALHAAGVRGARFNFAARLGLVPQLAEFHRTIARIRELGWFAKVFSVGEQLLDLDAELRKVPIPLVLDHMGRLDFALGTDQPAFRLLLERLQHDDWWIMLSNGDRSSGEGPPWDRALPFGRALYEAAPDRCIWGSDWPHVHYGGPLPDDAALVRLLRRYLPDEQAFRRVLVDNPARLFGFTPTAPR